MLSGVNFMIRYSIIQDKNPREIVLLRGTGCCWRRCTFCDYHLDSSPDKKENHLLNKSVLSNVTGIFKHLEVINSGSFTELDTATLNDLVELCSDKKIAILHFECHWLYRNKIPALREMFLKVGTTLKIKTGVESFDYKFRENVLCKGINEQDPAKIAEQFDECCLLFGITGQTTDGMRRDIEIGLKYFERVCINIFVKNKTKIEPNKTVVDDFINNVMPEYQKNPRVDILLNNTDFGVGGRENAK